MPKNKWKIARTALTKAPVKSSYNEYIDVEDVLQDVLACKGLDLCTYEATQLAEAEAIDDAITALEELSHDAVTLCVGSDAALVLDGQELCLTLPVEGDWRRESYGGVSLNGPQVLSFTLDATNAYDVTRVDEATGIIYSTNATATGTTLTITDQTVGGSLAPATVWTYIIFYKATV